METKKPLKHLCQQVSSPPKGCEREKICPSQSVLINNEIIIMGQWFLEEDNKVKREVGEIRDSGNERLKKRKTTTGNDSKAMTKVMPQPHPLRAWAPERAPCPCLYSPFLDPTRDWGVTAKCWDSFPLQGMPPTSWYRVMDGLRQVYGAVRASLDWALISLSLDRFLPSWKETGRRCLPFSEDSEPRAAFVLQFHPSNWLSSGTGTLSLSPTSPLSLLRSGLQEAGVSESLVLVTLLSPGSSTHF